VKILKSWVVLYPITNFNKQIISWPVRVSVRLGNPMNIVQEFQDESLKSRSILVDPFCFALIVDNLLSNAKRAIEEKTEEGKDPDLRVSVIISHDNGFILFEFKDLGNGMSEDTMKSLNEGGQVTTKEASASGVHGLGFHFCRELAKEMGGNLYVKESTLGVGTTVVLELRVDPESIKS